MAHKNLLIRHSKFFSAALNGNWAESKDRKMSLPEGNPESFAILVQFLYSGRIYSARDGDITTNKDGKVSDKEWTRLVEAWIMGQSLLSTTFRDAVADAMVTRINECDHCPTMLHTIVYKTGREDSAMRKLLVDVAVWQWPDAVFQSKPLEAGSEGFWRDIAIALSKIRCSGRQGVDPLKDPGFRYHDHVAEKDKPCYKTMF